MLVGFGLLFLLMYTTYFIIRLSLHCGGIFMRLKTSSLLEDLSDFEPIPKFNFDVELNTYCLLNNNLSDFRTDCLYIGKMSWLPATLPSVPVTFLLVKDIDAPNYESLESNYNCIYVSSDTDIWSLFNKIQSYFSNIIETTSYCHSIIELSNNTSDLQKVLDLGYELIGNPLLLVDASLNFIAHAGGKSVDEPLWKWILSKGYMPEGYVDFVLLDGMAEEEKYLQKPLFLWQREFLNHDQLVYRILSNNVSIGYLKILQYNKKISKKDKQIIKVLGNCLCKFLNKNSIDQASCSPIIASFLLSLLNGNLYDHDIIDMRMHQFNLKLYENMILIVIQLSDQFLNDNGKLLIFKRKIQNFLGRNNILCYNNNLVILYDYNSVQAFTKTELQNFESILSSHDCRAGISLEFHDLYSLPEHYHTACNALFTGQKLNIKKSIIQYSDIVFQHILLTYANHNDLSSLIHPAVTILQEKEPDKSDMFLETIYAYIDNGFKIVPTAKSLSVHYNTVKYRLNRITELTDLNLSDAYTIFQLQLSLIILDIKKRLEH